MVHGTKVGDAVLAATVVCAVVALAVAVAGCAGLLSPCEGDVCYTAERHPTREAAEAAAKIAPTD